MNKKGQTLIAFVLFIPVVFLFLALAIDTGLIIKEKTRVNSTLRTILKTTYKEYENKDYQDKVKTILEKNNIQTKDVIITTEDNKISITAQMEIESIFGKMIGLKTYQIKTGYFLTIEKDKITITKE